MPSGGQPSQASSQDDKFAQLADALLTTQQTIATLSTKVTELTSNVEILADQITAESARSTDLHDKSTKALTKHIKDLIKAMPSADGSQAISAMVSTMRPKHPPTLATTRMGMGHTDWLSQSLASIRLTG